MKMKTPCAVVSVMLLLLSCEKSIEWEITPTQDHRLVVEAILTDELGTQNIRLSTTYDDLNGNAPAVDDAMVVVRAGGTTYLFDPDAMIPGLYKSQIPFAVVSQLQYDLTIALRGTTYTASNTLSEVAPIPPIAFDRIDTLGNFTISDQVVPLYHDVQQAMYQIDLDWSHLQSPGENMARLYYYTFNALHVSEFLQPPHADVIFPKGTIAHITKYGLDADFAAYLQAVAIETTWNGNWFYGNPQNQPTNLSGGAVGFFATCAVLKQTMIVN